MQERGNQYFDVLEACRTLINMRGTLAFTQLREAHFPEVSDADSGSKHRIYIGSKVQAGANKRPHMRKANGSRKKVPRRLPIRIP